MTSSTGLTGRDASESRRGVELQSGLWLDTPQALQLIREGEAGGEISAPRAAQLRHFVEQGYVTFNLDLPEKRLDRVFEDVEELWRSQPPDVAYAYDGPPYSLARADAGRERQVRYRLHDIHSHSSAALDLYLNPQIFSLVELILGEPAVAIQSLFFEYGSEQILHRDPVVVPTGSPGHLVAAWIALEEIHPDSGALVYIPGSHRLPYFAFSSGDYRYDALRVGEAEVRAAIDFDDQQCRHLEPKVFSASKGEVLIWHASLRHGGGRVRDESLTRKSLVVHFSSRRTYKSRSLTLTEVDGDTSAGGPRTRVVETTRVLEQDGCLGFDSPMRGYPFR